MPAVQLIGYRTERGQHSIVSQSILPLATHLEQIPLGRNDYLFGVAILYVTTSINARRTSRIVFTDVTVEAFAQSTTRDSKTFTGYGGRSYTFTNWAHKGYDQSSDGRVSDSYFQVSAGRVRIKSTRINGSNLELEFENTHVSTTAWLTVDIEYRVSRRQP